MKLSSKQRKELNVLLYWIPSNCVFGDLSDDQVAAFFAWSDRGIAHGRNVLRERDGFCALYYAKNRRDLQITSYLEDWGYTMDARSFGEMPYEVIEDIAKRMKKPQILEMWDTK